MDTQGKKWYGARNMKISDPAKYPTPYGGRLEWTLPGSTQVICLNFRNSEISAGFYSSSLLKTLLLNNQLTT